VTEVAARVSLIFEQQRWKPVKNKLRITFLLGALFAFAQTNSALACACCTNTGQRYVENTKLQSFQRAILEELRFAKRANLFVGERDFADIKGIANPSETYAFAVTREKDRFVFSFRDEKKNEGSLTLAVPDAIAIFEIDPREPNSPASGGLGPLLYKEWRLTAPFAGTGIFKAGNGGYQRITLILQGRGRNCPDAGQFTHWTISVYGPLGNYLLYGELEKQ
jgi:hypothetical protein